MADSSTRFLIFRTSRHHVDLPGGGAAAGTVLPGPEVVDDEGDPVQTQEVDVGGLEGLLALAVSLDRPLILHPPGRGQENDYLLGIYRDHPTASRESPVGGRWIIEVYDDIR